jgi:hypothetical protein
MEELLRLRAWIVVTIEAIIDEASNDAGHELLTENAIIFESLANEFSDEVNTVIRQRKHVEAKLYEETPPNSDIVQD